MIDLNVLAPDELGEQEHLPPTIRTDLLHEGSRHGPTPYARNTVRLTKSCNQLTYNHDHDTGDLIHCTDDPEFRLVCYYQGESLGDELACSGCTQDWVFGIDPEAESRMGYTLMYVELSTGRLTVVCLGV